MNKIKLLQILVLIASIIQIISPAFSSFRDGTDADNTDPQFTPAGYTFGIWGLITLLALCYGIYQMLPSRENARLHQQIASKLVVLYLFFAFWLFAYTQDWVVLTVMIFLSMFFLAYFTFQQILQPENKLTIYDKIFLEAQIGFYLGWSSVAIFANTGAALKFYGLSDLGANGIIWQTVLLVAALTNATYVLYKTKANYFFGATIVWAFVGIFFGLSDEIDTTFLQIVSISALVIFLFSLYKFRKQTITTQKLVGVK
jgi:translocator protein